LVRSALLLALQEMVEVHVLSLGLWVVRSSGLAVSDRQLVILSRAKNLVMVDWLIRPLGSAACFARIGQLVRSGLALAVAG